MDFDVKNPPEELPFVWNNFISDKCLFLVDFVSGKNVPGEGFFTIAGKGKASKQGFRRYNRAANEITQKKRKDRHTLVMSRSQRNERKKQIHRQQRSKVNKLRSKIWSSYKFAVSMTHNRHLKASVEVQPYWKTTHQFNYTELQKLILPLTRVKETVLSKRGILRKYQNSYDSVTSTSPASLRTREVLGRTMFYHPRSVLDKVLQQYCSKKEGNVFATSRVLALLMGCCRAVQSFDIPVRKKDGIIFLDHRASSRVSDYTANETARRPPSVAEKDKKKMNGSVNLKRERTRINRVFQEEILLPSEESYKFDVESPFKLREGMQKKMAEKGYIYKKFRLSPKIEIVCRCEVDGMLGNDIEKTKEIKGGKGGKSSTFYPYMINRAVHEFEYTNKGNWAELLESSPGTIIVNELSNNSFEFGRWIFEALLAKARHFHVGFCTRRNIKNDKNHDLLKVERYDSYSIAEQFHVNIENGFGILENILSSIMDLEDGEYLLLKIPNKQCVNCYRVVNKAKKDDVPQKDEDEDDESEDEVDE